MESKKSVLRVLVLVSSFNVLSVCADDVDIYLQSNTACSRAVSTALLATTVAVNVYNETRSLDDIFLTLFEIDQTQVWHGNVKKLALKSSQGESVSEILDVSNFAQALAGVKYTRAINASDGRINNDALTFWTVPEALPAPDLQKGEVSGKDGRSVMRGGAGQVIPQFISGMLDYSNTVNSRQIFTENAAANGLMAFDASDKNADAFYALFQFSALGGTTIDALLKDVNISDTLPISEKQHRMGEAMMHFARGVNIAADNYDYAAASGPARHWILGDIIHSKPLALNYGNIPGWAQVDNPYVSIIFGANDGMLHFLQNTEGNARESGSEKYAFLPRELLRIIPVLAHNETAMVNLDKHHPYGMDGQVTALVFDDVSAPANHVNTIDSGIAGVNDYAYIYAGMRRGGKSYYAFDVTDPLDTPKYLGKIDKSRHDFSELGLTFSNAVPALVKFDGNVTPVLIFGGGYDVDKDDCPKSNCPASDAAHHHINANGATGNAGTGYYDNTHGNTPDTEGNAIYMVNALSLELIWKSSSDILKADSNKYYRQAGMQYAIPSTIKPVDSNGDGYMDRMYVGDIAGNVWRGDFPECSAEWSCENRNHRRDHWSMTRLAAFATGKAAGDVRFFHPPAVVFTYDELGEYDAVIIGSGDRENPLESTDQNRLYMIKDRKTRSGIPPDKLIGLTDMADVTQCVVGNEAACSGLLSSSALNYGWRMDFAGKSGNAKAGEKAIYEPVVIAGKILLTTYIPAAQDENDCSLAQGGSNLYLLNVKNGTAANDNSMRYVEFGPAMAGDITVAGQTVILPYAAPMDFLLPSAGKDKYQDDLGKNPQRLNNSDILTFPAGVAGSSYTYWRENTMSDIK